MEHWITWLRQKRVRGALSCVENCLVWSMILLMSSFPAAAQMPTIRVPVRLVSVPILVASKDGKYLAGLSAADFRLSDEGRRQTIKVDVDPLPICVVVAVQVSEDVREYLPFVQRVGNLLANAVPGANGNAALITYSDEISVVRGLMAAIFPLLSRRFRPGARRPRWWTRDFGRWSY